MSAPRFPDEIWLEILSRLDYKTLSSSVPLVCRDFNRMLQRSDHGRSPLDEVLFRSHVNLKLGSSKKNPRYKIHPILRKVFYRESYGGKLALRLDYSNETWHQHQYLERLFRLTVRGRYWSDNATSPPTGDLTVKFVRTDINDFTSISTHSAALTSEEKAITLFDVLVLASMLFGVSRHRFRSWLLSDHPTDDATPFTAFDVTTHIWRFLSTKKENRVPDRYSEDWERVILPRFRDRMAATGFLEKANASGVVYVAFNIQEAPDLPPFTFNLSLSMVLRRQTLYGANVEDRAYLLTRFFDQHRRSLWRMLKQMMPFLWYICIAYLIVKILWWFI